jgi:hypothetical protein
MANCAAQRNLVDKRDFRFWPEASFSCVAAARPESCVKPTCQDGPTDAIDAVDGAHSTASMCQRVVALSEPL